MNNGLVFFIDSHRPLSLYSFSQGKLGLKFSQRPTMPHALHVTARGQASLMKYLGHLPRSDWLYDYLRYDILPQMGVSGAVPDFRVYTIKASNRVYLYKDRRTNTRVIGKFFSGVGSRPHEVSCQRMEREYRNLVYLRSLGFTGYPHYVARPLGRKVSLNCLLVMEYCYGRSLNDFIVNAILHGAGDGLFRKLTSLASFLASMHNGSAKGVRVDFNRESAYFERIVEQLRTWGHIGWDESREILWLKDLWRGRACMWEDQQVFVHGDVTPTNFLFGDDPWVVALDLERMKSSDRAFDLGRLTAEVKHFFMQYTGSREAAEPFIGHFLWEYAGHFPDRRSAFSAITSRLPFYMGLTLLRIARNSWIMDDYRRKLVDEAKQTLR
jgi:aminoglycoside phosphotransferase (APT) family kinase protein